MTIKRPLAAAGATVLMAFALTACGGGASSAPTDASKDKFCDTYMAVGEDMSGEPTEEQWNKAKDQLKKLEDVGTPKGISKDAREGFEIFLDAVSDLDYDDAKDMDNSDSVPGVSKDDEKKVGEFFTYVATECMDMPDMSDLPTDIPTDLGTEFSTE